MGQKQHSKRQRKQKAHASLKRKQVQRQDHDTDMHTDPPPRRVTILSMPVAFPLTVPSAHRSETLQGGGR